jgi:hypothetical protein
MFLMVRLALLSIELEIHPGIENIPVTSRSSIQEDSTLNPRNQQVKTTTTVNTCARKDAPRSMWPNG